MESAPGRRVSNRTDAAAAAVLTITVTAMGLQLLRVFVPTLLFYLREVVGIPTTGLGLIGLAVFASTFFTALLLRLGGLRGALILSAGGTALVRFAEQLSRSVPLDMVLSAVGVGLFLFYLPLALSVARAGERQRPRQFALALLLGVALDTAIHTGAATYDLSWQNGLLAPAIVLLLVAAALLALRLLVNRIPAQAVDLSWREALPLLGIGPWLMLQLIVFQSVARAAAVTGWRLPLAAALVTTANILGLFLAWQLPRLDGRRVRLITAAAGLLLILIFIPQGVRGPAAAAVLLLGQPLSAILLLAIVGSVPAAGAAGQPGFSRTTVVYGSSFLLFTALFFAYFASYDLPLGFRAGQVLPLVALVLAFGGILAVPAPGPARPAPATSLLPLLLLPLFAPLLLWLTWSTPPATATVAQGATLRFMTYNLHNGFDITGRLDLEALATVIEENEADVVALQEIARGWLNAGSVDMASWLARRLDMEVAFGPTTADGQWGNALLSRYPLVSSRNLLLPPPELPLTRGYLDASVDLGGQTLRVLATHLHHVPEENQPRLEQAQVLLDAWARGERTIVAGDLNAWPEWPEMQLLAAGGLVDVTAALATGPTLTNPSQEPFQQLDYIWISPDLAPRSFAVPHTLASDHLPIVAELQLRR